MKQFIFGISFLLLTFQLWAQDYRCIQNSGEQLFTNDEYYRAIRIDSAVEFNNHTSHYLFRTLGTTDINQSCYSDEHPSWIGPQVDVYVNGDHYFYNISGDSILIKTAGSVGDEWICYPFDNGDFVLAELMAVEYENFLGQSDSVKVIRFNAYNLSGELISNEVNGKEIRISKSWGMVQALNFKLFPDLYDYPTYETINEYVLCGMSEPESGIQNLSLKRIYDFEVGDEFHICEYSISWMEEFFYYYEIHRIIGKEWISDTLVAYETEQCIRRHLLFSDTLILISDTAVVTINLKNHQDANINDLPDKVFGTPNGDEEYYWYSQHAHPDFNAISKTFFGGYWYEGSEDCIFAMIDYDYSRYYLQGLGGPYWHYGSFGSESHRALVYYKKGDEEWGTPYDCDSLMVSVENKMPLSRSVTITPNPMKDQALVSFENPKNQEISFQLYGPTGKLVKSYQVTGTSFFLNKGDLIQGLYILVMTDQANNSITQKLIIQ